MELLISSLPPLSPSCVTVSGGVSLNKVTGGTVMATITPEVLLINATMATVTVTLANNRKEIVMKQEDMQAISLQEVVEKLPYLFYF